MATINFLKRKDSKNIGALGSVIKYCAQEYKTLYNNSCLISGVNCNAQRAVKDFINTKKQFDKTNGIQFYYAVQSFDESDKLSPALAHQIGIEWVEECYPNFEAVICTHLDTDNIHNHIIINSVNALDGHKIHQNKNDIQRVRSVNDRLCLKYNLSVCKSNKKNVDRVKPREYYAAMSGNSWKTQLAIDIDHAMLYAKSKMDFIKLMNQKDYKVIWTSERDTILYQCPHGKMCRDFKLHDEKYLKGAMENEFAKRKEFLQRYEGYDEKGTDTSNLYSGIGRKLEQPDKPDSKAEFYNETAAGNLGNANYLNGNERFDEQANRKAEQYTNGIGEHINEFSGCDANDSNRFSDEYSGPNGQARKQSKGNNLGNIETGWEHEREFFEQSFRTERNYEQYIPQTPNRHLDTDSNSNLISWSIRFMGNLTNLITNTNRRYRSKRIKLSRKEIEKRLAHGQKTSGYEEYEDSNFEQSM